jgi:hypothetical protein
LSKHAKHTLATHHVALLLLLLQVLVVDATMEF